jgi:hypothetical protein
MIGTMSIGEQYAELLKARQATSATPSQKYFIWSLVGLKIHSWVMQAEGSLGIPQVVKYALAVYFIVTIIYLLVKRPQNPSYYGFMVLPIAIFCVYSLIMVGRTFRLDPRYFQFLLAAKFYVMPFFFPVLILFIRFDMRFVKYVMHFSLKFLPWLLLVMLTVLASLNIDLWDEHLYRLHIFNFALPLVLLNIHYLNNKSRQRVLLIIYFLGLITIGSFYGRRGYVLDMLFMFVFYFILTSMNKVVSLAKKVRLFVIIALSVFAFVLMFGMLKNSLYIFERGLDSDAWDETRGAVFTDFFADFGTVAGDWIWGRGLEGKVLRTMDTEGGGYGDTIENGYLFTLLKAGGLYLGIMVLLFLRAAYLAWFRSSNQFAKSLAALIIIHLIVMIQFNLPVFSSEYVMIWICVAMAYSKDIRKLDDKQVKLILNL